MLVSEKKNNYNKNGILQPKFSFLYTENVIS